MDVKHTDQNQNLNLRVAHLPALTWNRLGVNDATVSVDLAGCTPLVTSLSGHNQPGVSLKTANISEMKKALTPFETVKREAVIAGKTAIYAEQHVPTGLGAEFEAFMDGHALGQIISFTEKEEGASVIFDTRPKGTDSLHSEEDGSETMTIANFNVLSQIIEVPEGVTATVIDVIRGANDRKGVAARLVRARVGQKAKLHLVRVCLAGEGFTVLDDTGAVLEEDAVFDYTRIVVGTGKCYAGCAVSQQGDRSAFHFNCGYDLVRQELLEMNDVTIQRGKDTESTMRLHGVLAGHAQKTFRGTIDFRSGSAGSVGDQEEDVLLLDDTVINKSMPIILCEEENVEGRHAASVGRLSEEILFYLKTRGIDEETARRLMVAGKINTAAALISDESVKTAVTEAVNALF